MSNLVMAADLPDPDLAQFGPLTCGHRWPVSMTVALSSLVMPRS